MGIIRIALTDENGRIEAEAASDTHVLDDLLPGAEDSEFQCLRFIDMYGDTIFNRLQVRQVGVEWEKLAKGAQEAAAPLFDEVSALIRRCATEPHTYLKFFGD